MTRNLTGLIGGSTVAFNARGSRFLNCFALATFVAGANWFVQSRIAAAEQVRQEEIIARVNAGKTVELNDLRDIEKLDDLEGCKIKVQGELGVGRSVIKRQKHGEDGYIVLAPFIVGKTLSTKDIAQITLNEKYMLNLGWIPQSNRQRIRETISCDVIPEDETPEEYAIDDSAPRLVTVSAFVRKGENRDIYRGYNNWVQGELYKFIDLDQLSNKYCSIFPSFRRVYLDRITSENDSISDPTEGTSRLDYIKQIREQIKYNHKARKDLSIGVGCASYVAAILACLL